MLHSHRLPFLLLSLGIFALVVPATASADGPVPSPSASGSSSTAATAPDRVNPRTARPGRRVRPKTSMRLQLRGAPGGSAEILKPVRAVGAIAPFRAGQRVEVIFFRNGRPARRKVVPVTRAGRNHGAFQAVVRPDRVGRWAAGARFRPTRAQTGAFTARRAWNLTYPSLRKGQCGPVVVGFKRAMNRMGYIVNGGPCLGSRTERGVLAYRKVNGMSRNFRASSGLVRDVYHRRGGYRVRYPGTPGTHMEAPLSKEVLVFARGDRPVAIYPVSVGKSSTPTVTGSFQMDWTQPGFNNLGMYYSWYFYRGYAIHGYESVPNYPASNGCLRTFMADQPEIFNRISKGDWIHLW